MPKLTRRQFVGSTAAVAAAGVLGPEAAGPAAASGQGLDQVRHIVVLMQENRSFDHYLGTLSGVRGFDDRQGLVFPDGTGVLRQPDPARKDGGRMLPYRMDTTRYNAQNADGLPHGWKDGHEAINRGAMNKWISAKGERCMGYFTREDIPYQYALADAFTVADHYFCSMAGPTDPNRLYLWSGTAGPGTDGTTGPFTDNSVVTDNPVADWTTYAERLERAGVSWRVYHNPGKDPRYGDYDDNGLSYFRQFHAFPHDDPRYVNAMTKFDLTAFDRHCKDGTLPAVSWLVAPYLFSEHPAASPDYGADWVNTALQSLFANPEVWKHTVFLVMYDENDGYFDHVVPPFPAAGTPGEFVGGQPIGLGNRVPLWVISPWSRGGWVNSQVFDHTSVLRFMERVTGVREPNISDWRRAVCGDLTSCFDFARPDFSVPSLPDTKELVRKADAGAKLPPVKLPGQGQQTLPVQEPGARPYRMLPYAPDASVTVDRTRGRVVCAMTNTGGVAFHFTVFPNIRLPFAGTPFTVAPGARAEYVWETAGTDGAYDFTVYGADGFLRRFKGTVKGAAVAERTARELAASTTAGRYDVTVTGADGFLRRVAGTWYGPAAG
ncbi:phosphocholine-specific phospholipase C [Streptomyces albireticuli]|uniref:phospholipase C n=1 Tax=Streptomyces albireticuli TaxID=1940 RepID=A0A2A2D4Y4_9ACTN|nr:phospholipase C, phosphocholine-specific [Streptomyces albireticuli]MCD9142920.1 phospholipase C, phosphocholine-specific [Streptomyces albireticuli]MCD9162761.1 phospholipase C, phosphocholine-specific [Streptomyces albireticuli]MCD9192321.1 phospholipase C, phosphocholine-specific [Streptomyces albireticuli]PAU46372.1 phospholipase C, phosphocholine-specific [Streptomyces albireticuli]